MNIERYSHVMHISSTVCLPLLQFLKSKQTIVSALSLNNISPLLQVKGELLDDLTSWDALRAALPVGTVSGAPKVKP